MEKPINSAASYAHVDISRLNTAFTRCDINIPSDQEVPR